MTHPIEPIIKRVLEGAGEDRELEREVALALGWRPYLGLWRTPDGLYADLVPDYTANLNAINYLRERELPGWEFDIEITKSGFVGVTIHKPPLPGDACRDFEDAGHVSHKERARAGFAAVLVGIVRKDQKDGR